MPDTRRVYEPPTRMAPRLAPIPRVYTPEPDKAVKRAVKKPPRKPIVVRGRVKIDDQYSGTLTFSPAFGDDAGRTYGPLSLTPGSLSPDGLKEFYVRCLIEQHRVDPLLQGFRTLWEPPPGWVKVDGRYATLFDEAISNPLYITRVYRTPATVSVDVGFRVIVEVKYRP